MERDELDQLLDRCFERKSNSAYTMRQADTRDRRIWQLKVKLEKKNEVIAELLEVHMQLKRQWGTLNRK